MSDITAFACVIIRNTASVDRYENLGLYSHILTQDVNPVYVCWRQVSHVLTSVFLFRPRYIHCRCLLLHLRYITSERLRNVIKKSSAKAIEFEILISPRS